MPDDIPIRTLTFYPFAYALLDERLENYCWYCLRENSASEPLKRCSLCKIALYCNKTCQNFGWVDHMPECRVFINYSNDASNSSTESPATGVPCLDVRLLARIVWRYKCITKNNSHALADSFWTNRTSRRTIMQICDHADEIRGDSYATVKFERLYKQLKQYYDKKYLCDTETVFQLHCRNFINRHSISDDDYLNEIAKGLYLDLCAYNHSCAPNAIYTCEGFIATLRPLTDEVNLSDASTTFYTYIDLLTSKQLRRKLLSETWYFNCRCSRCMNKNDHFLTSVPCFECGNAVLIFDEFDKLKDSAVCDCGHKVTTEVISKALVSMRSIDAILDRSTSDLTFLFALANEDKHILHSSNIYYVKILQAIIGLLDPKADINKLLELHLEATNCMKLCFPERHPALAYHFLNIGTFYCQLGKYNLAKLHLDEALYKFRLTLGLQHNMSKKCLEWIEQCDKLT